MHICVLAFLCVFAALSTTAAQAETRKLKLYFLHTGERAEITYKKNGRYVQSGLNKINRFLRDWRKNEPTKMDPKLLDLIWEVYQETGSRKHIHVISAYRSPATNSLLRKRGRGVARKSQHTLGKALDFFIPGVPLRKLRNIGLKQGLGGVGYYPKSGSPFVHMDTGRVRHWPRMSRKELVSVFPRGKTLHVPTDGKPLARYNQAKAEYERKLKGQGRIQIAKAEDIEKKPGFFAKLLGRDDEDEGAIGAVSAPTPVRTKTEKPATTAPATQVPSPAPPEPLVVEPVQTPETILAALPASSLPIPSIAPRVVVDTPITEPETEATPEAIDEPIADPLVDDNASVAIASVVPVKRPEIEVAEEVQIASAEVSEPAAPAPGSSQGVFTASEIEDLRKQVYSAIRSEREGIRPAPTPVEPIADEGRLLVASATSDIPSGDAASSKLSIIVPEPNPQRPAALAIAEQLAEPATSATQTSAELEVAATEPVEADKIASAAIAPVPSPAETDEAAPESFTTASVAIPVKAPRVAIASAEPELPKAGAAEATTLTLEQFKSANLDERLVGKWALAADTSIARIAEINPPAYGRNVIRELPDTVLSRGFSQDALTNVPQSFSGSSLEFLDFTRFN